jgi:hypothetical protein
LNNIIADPDARRNPNAFQVHNDLQLGDGDENPIGIQNLDLFLAQTVNSNEEIPKFGYRLLGNKLQAFVARVTIKGQNYLHFLEFQLTNKKEHSQPTVLFSIQVQQNPEYFNVSQNYVL